MKLIKIAKFVLPNSTYVCGHCSSQLNIVDITENPKHFFNPGQLFSCFCSKSQVWANSVRRMDDLVNYCDNKSFKINPEQYGFCNDKFCPKCWSTFSVIKNSALVLDNNLIERSDLETLDVQQLVDEKRLMGIDIHGCRSCDENKLLLHQGIGSEGGEYDGQKTIAQWFKNNQSMWRNKTL